MVEENNGSRCDEFLLGLASLTPPILLVFVHLGRRISATNRPLFALAKGRVLSLVVKFSGRNVRQILLFLKSALFLAVLTVRSIFSEHM
jgi:hypothetical protein